MTDIGYKGVSIAAELGPLMRHMEGANESRESLQTLQHSWDNLSILGHLSATGTDLSHTRHAFHDLTSKLVNHLARESLRNMVKSLRAKAQVAIDILVRNLFERTADVGFLATDTEVQSYLQAWHDTSDTDELAQMRRALEQRFVEYVAKYSVYFDIIVTDLDGHIVARLDSGFQLERSTDPLLNEALQGKAYVETFRETDLLDGDRGLLYSSVIRNAAGTQALGVLTLCFKFENETEGIFSHLQEDNHTVIAYLDAQHRVIASADPWQLAVGAPLMVQGRKDYQLLYFSGNEYVATLVETKGYQGYAGPGWYALALIPMQYAFRENASTPLRDLSPELLTGAMRNPALFSEDLRQIPRQAHLIQSDLNRSVWNGNIRQTNNSEALNNNFSKVLLREISNTGRKTQRVFEQSINRLTETVMSAVLESATFQAGLAIDIMDRNLYERANDCRWWALNSFIRQTLTDSDQSTESRQKLRQILHYINSLYTVYTGIVVFDKKSEVIEVSTSDLDEWIGKNIEENWVSQCLSLRSSQHYAVSDFSETCLYKNGSTYIYTAALASTRNTQEAVGGIGIVFDGTTQFQAMLTDALPTDASGSVLEGAFGLFVHANGTVIASTYDAITAGSKVDLPASIFNLSKGQSYSGVFEYEGIWYAIGAVMSHGYREYKNHNDAYQNPLAAVVCIRLCENTSVVENLHLGQRNNKAEHHAVRIENGIELASFYAGSHWLGIESRHVVESIGTSNVTRIPDSARYVSGVMLYQDNPISIIDLSALLSGQNADLPEYALVIVLHIDGEKKIGLLVNELGDIPIVAQENLQNLPASLSAGDSVLESVVKEMHDDRGQMMIVISHDKLKALLQTNPAAWDQTKGDCLSDSAVAEA